MTITQEQIDSRAAHWERQAKAGVRMCCHLEFDKLACTNEAVVEIWDDLNTDSTESCQSHIYDMLSDGANTIVAFS